MNEIPRNVETALGIVESVGGITGDLPGYFHEKFSVRHLLFDVIVNLFWLALMPYHMRTKGFSGGSSGEHGRSEPTAFELTPERCVIGEVSLPWTQVLFIRLTRPSPHLSYVTLQVFEKNGPEHRWRLGADAYKELSWLADVMHRLREKSRTMDVPDTLFELMKGVID